MYLNKKKYIYIFYLKYKEWYIALFRVYNLEI